MPQPIPAAPGAECLFFDLAEMESLQNVALSVCEARKHPMNPVMERGDHNQWDSAQVAPWPSRTVLYDEQEKLFKCWYHGSCGLRGQISGMGYAISRDGIAWEKPELGLLEFNGSRRNNLIHTCPYGAVIKDMAEPDPRRRYKLHMRDFMRYSADGIHWPEDWPAEGTAQVTMKWSGPKAWDVVMFIRDDQDPNPARRYKFIFQYYDKTNKPGPEEARFKALACGPDELNIDADSYSPVLCPNDGFEHENHFLMYVPYKGHWLILYECGWYQPDGTGKYGRYIADIRMAHSRDGVHFTRLNPHQIVIPRGEAGSWDEQFIVITDKAVIRDDMIYLYYCGQDSGWASWPPQNAAPNVLGSPGAGARRMGLATLRLDGFTCLHVTDRTAFGQATTKMLEWTGGAPARLSVNLSNARPGRDWLQVEALDADERPLPGFSRADCRPISAESTSAPVTWTGGDTLSAGDRRFRLRFHLYGAAQLHAFKLL